MIDFITWWTWRRWRIYCPSYKVTHLFDQNRILEDTPWGIMCYPSIDSFENSLFHWDEAFISPCLLNEKWGGSAKGNWVPKIRFIGLETGKDD